MGGGGRSKPNQPCNNKYIYVFAFGVRIWYGWITIRGCYISILFKTQYILPHLIIPHHLLNKTKNMIFIEILSCVIGCIYFDSVKDIILCNWHIFWQNTLYLYLGKSKKIQDDHYKWLNWRHENYSRTTQEKCNLQVSIEARFVEIH